MYVCSLLSSLSLSVIIAFYRPIDNNLKLLYEWCGTHNNNNNNNNDNQPLQQR